MPYFSRSVFSCFRFVLLTVSVLLVLGLNQQTVRVLRPTKAATAAPLRATVVKQKVQLEATAALAHFVASPLLAWLPPSAPAAWLPALRRRLMAPRPLAGVRMGEVFRQRLLAVALSPQAP